MTATPRHSLTVLPGTRTDVREPPAVAAETAAPDVIQGVWARVFMDSLRRAGVRDVVVSPGSRSTPLVVAAELANLACHTIIDERSAGFFALGRARLTGAPVALVCTSGTAGANYFPALIEAGCAHIPLIAITADLPPELQGCAAPQTIDQTKMFGSLVREFIDLGPPEAARGRLRALRRKAVQAVTAAQSPIPGPVHVNAPARKPLEPAPPRTPADIAMIERGDAVLGESTPRVMRGPVRAAEAEIQTLARALMATPRGLIGCGPILPHHDGLTAAIRRLAAATGFPVLAEAASQVRFAGVPGPTAEFARPPAEPAEPAEPALCDAVELLLGSPSFRAGSRPEVVVQIGPPLTTKAFSTYLAENEEAVRCVIAPWGWNDPQSGADVLVMADPVDTVTRLAAAIEAMAPGARAERPARSRWAARFSAGNEQAWAAVEEVLAAADGDAMHEGPAMRAAVSALPRGAVLALGNSLPIRTVDIYCRAQALELTVLSQRGANGIDGLISATAGAADAARRPTALILGDVSFCHDLGGLAALRLGARRSPIALVVIDNEGGRIFDMLPIAERAGDLLDTHWRTPPGCDLRAAAAVFGHAYECAETPTALADAVARALAREAGATLIHARVSPGSAAADRARLGALMEAAVAALPTLPDAELEPSGDTLT
ncbi:2-succinyl-5-enolpyruvyl-6-hydroxy-3-cyclohexene-1-carboxylic-acid synthase [Haliangium sp.]|uniref:2-succinyl-5-enolpyruvyl-6-hydroxy-3- cyclohexene-1-carboxylic-acid synthase n=1 Tax=Haliangium sp. TaxID=2663208 RepID=UPI003D0F415B